ncbi:hypothetical protein [Algoriphagus sp. AK58]|uniref:hypothetical protein n=1 Tax=Algoriphagus sp. AK58 TaxID=1406877 RepID=UPI001650CB85|nr:hypothetical protein [Algoriphagus sp. AK58]MBC6365440.1 hypothetical protein [Algoriphagus sp. AK58]
MIITIFLWFLLSQIPSNQEQELAQQVIIHYLESLPPHNQDGKFFVSELLDSVFVKRYERVLNPQNDFVYKGLNEKQRSMVQDLLQIKEPLPFELTELIAQKKFKIRPLNEIDRNDWESSSIKVSRARVSPDGNEACLILEYVCGPKCGQGVLIFAQKENHSWTISARRRLWIA